MNLLHLKYALEVEKTGSITRAAQNLYMGQPNLSKAIRELEAETGFPLFERTPKGAIPTRRGAEFLTYASTIISQVDELESLYKPRPQAAVELFVSAPRATYVADAFTAFVNHFSNQEHLDMYYRETSSMEAVNDVAGGNADFAVVRYQMLYEDYYQKLMQDNHLRCESIWEFRMMLLFSQTHPLAELEDVPYHLLTSCTEIVHGDFQVPSLSFSQIRKSTEPRAHARRIHIYDRGSQFELLRQVQGSYMWVSPVPQDVLTRNGLVLRPCSLSGMTNRDVLVYPDRKALGRYGKEFLGILRHTVQRFAPGRLDLPI